MPRATTRPVESGNVLAHTAPIIIEKHSFGESRSANLSAVETQADKTFLSLRKKLLESPEVAAIKARDTHFRKFMQANATPFRPGFWLVAIPMVERVHDAATTWEVERGLLADAAAEAYPRHVERMPEILKDQFNPMNYPSASRYRETFWVNWRFVEFGVPNVLRELRADVLKAETEKTVRLAAQARTVIEQHLLASLHEVTTHVSDLLQPRSNGSKPSLRPGCLDRFVDFLATVEARNVTNSAELRRMTEQVRRIGQGLTVDALRDDDALRARTSAALATIGEAVAALVTEGPERAIRLREEAMAG